MGGVQSTHTHTHIIQHSEYKYENRLYEKHIERKTLALVPDHQ